MTPEIIFGRSHAQKSVASPVPGGHGAIVEPET
jgi:hypothetical protein